LVDHFCIGDDLLVLVLGDVSDKGAGAALMMARTHALFRSLAVRPDAAQLFRAPEQAVRLVNSSLAVANATCMFVTLLLASFDATSGRLSYVRAGHIPPFLRRAGGAIERLDSAGGLPLGLMEDAVHKAAVAYLGPGDGLLIVTDGITEATDPGDNLFGNARVAELLMQLDIQVADPLQRLMSQVREFEAGRPPSDDVAAIMLTLGSG
jgi:sigma-B regulation protein RsbU (phosphoserine phosphatase)